MYVTGRTSSYVWIVLYMDSRLRGVACFIAVSWLVDYQWTVQALDGVNMHS